MINIGKKRILIMEGNPHEKRLAAQRLGIKNSSAIYAEALLAHFSDLEIDILFGADAETNARGNRAFSDYAGFVISGSSLHAYDTDRAVTRQIDYIREAAEVGLPILGSCWGLQIAAVAAGGEVRYNPKGREVGFARKVMLNAHGRAHPMMHARATVFDAPCIHCDEVARLPEKATLLASNAHSLVQAAAIPLAKSQIWAVQYHPEFDTAHIAHLYRLYAKDLVKQGFFEDEAVLAQYAAALTTLATEPNKPGLAWRLGLDADVLDDRTRRSEIIAWVEHQVLGHAFKQA